MLSAALDLIAEGGFTALTLRPLADRMGTTVSKLTYQVGDKNQIITRLIQEARALDHENGLAWVQLSTRSVLSPALLADVVDVILDEAATRHRRLNLFFLELVQASAWDETVRAALRPWMADRKRFWRTICPLTPPSALMAPPHMAGPHIEHSELVHAFAIDELSFSLALNAEPAYRLMRKQCINRLCSGFLGQSPVAGDGLFHALFDNLGEAPGEVHVDHNSQAFSGWRGEAVALIADLITTRGVGAVTHRAVAAKVGVASSTLAYHFPAHEDLVIGGLEFIIRALQSQLAEDASRAASAGPGSEQSTGPQGLNVSRATFAVALAATRNSALLACAADMRRRRGINFHKLLERALGVDPRLDRFTSQTLSVVMIGQIMAAEATDALAAGQGADVSWATAILRSGLRAPLDSRATT